MSSCLYIEKKEFIKKLEAMNKMFGFPVNWRNFKGEKSHLLYNFMAKSMMESITQIEKSAVQVDKTIKVKRVKNDSFRKIKKKLIRNSINTQVRIILG